MNAVSAGPFNGNDGTPANIPEKPSLQAAAAFAHNSLGNGSFTSGDGDKVAVSESSPACIARGTAVVEVNGMTDASVAKPSSTSDSDFGSMRNEKIEGDKDWEVRVFWMTEVVWMDAGEVDRIRRRRACEEHV